MAICLLAVRSAFSQLSIIPEPVSTLIKEGHFKFQNNLIIVVNNKEVNYTASAFVKQLSDASGLKVSVSSTGPGAIRLLLNPSPEKKIGDEGYHLDISPDRIEIHANTPAGIYYAVQTLLQLLPKEIESKSQVKGIAWEAPCVSIMDYPRFAWRGLMFDVSRHFFTKKEVEDFIDEMVKYKYNLLHLTLCNDEGWRIEIKSLPKLTQVGAWNVKRVGYFGTFDPPAPDEPRDYGGFYTQDDIREILQYAKARYVNILPEIDMPGHSLAAVVSYPELSCTEGAENYKVNSGEPFIVWPAKGHFYGLIDNTLCPANEKVYPFIDKVITEIARLFPFEYIHVGGDECSRNFWEKSEAVKQLMQKENLKTLDEVQSYFEKRVEKIVESKGKKMIGWDEILEGGLAPNAAVMSWRGIKGGIEAAKMGHEVVMTPTNYCYLDYMQSDESIEPHVYSTLLLDTAYAFEPVPDGVDEKYVKGGQANLWTEQVFNVRHMQYMLWPRSMATAECLWSPKEKKNWDLFAKKVENQFDRLDVEQVKYARAFFDPVITVKKDAKDSLVIELSAEVKGLEIYYCFDNTHPDNFYPKYAEPLPVPKQAYMIRVITYRDGKPIGREISVTIDELKKRAGIKKG
jgi:hexosaminidase